MSIIRNLAPNPSGEGGLWLPWTGSTTISLMTSSAAVSGTAYQRASVTDAATNIGIRTTGIPVAGLSAVSAMQAGKTNASAAAIRLRLLFRDAGGADVGQVFSAWIPSAGAAVWLWPQLADVPVPASATTVETLIYVVHAAGGGPIDPVASQFLDADAVVVTAGPLAPGYFDGNSVGWAWEGAAHASASRGPSEVYRPEAQLLRDGARIAWADQIAGFEETAESGSRLQVSPFAGGIRSRAHVRPSGPSTGRARIRFTRELGTGKPGERALALYSALRTGAPVVVRHELSLPGLVAEQALLPTGAISRRLEADTHSVWLVEFDFEALDV